MAQALVHKRKVIRAMKRGNRPTSQFVVARMARLVEATPALQTWYKAGGRSGVWEKVKPVEVEDAHVVV